MRDLHPHNAQSSTPKAVTIADSAAMVNFARLQLSQAEFLAWLDASEQTADVDRYIYRKIR